MKYWKNGNLRFEGKFKDGGACDGSHCHYWSNGQLKLKHTYKNKERVGEWASYNENGSLVYKFDDFTSLDFKDLDSEEKWDIVVSLSSPENIPSFEIMKNLKKVKDIIPGFLNEGTIYYDEFSGRIDGIETGLFKKGKRDGLWLFKTRNYTDVDDGPILLKEGPLNQKVNFKNGMMDGIYESYFTNSFIGEYESLDVPPLRVKGNYKNNKKEGLWIEYYETKDLVFLKENFKDGKRHGLTTSYWPSGKITRSYKYYEDKPVDGNDISYWEDGKVMYEANYKNGEIEGRYNEFNRNGNLISHKSGFYKQGKKISD